MIIGICGKAGSGKDTVADILVRDLGFVKVAFADPLKRVCKDIFNFSDEQLWGPSEKRNEPDFRYLRTPHQQGFDPVDGRPTTIDAQYLTPRYALQQLGTEWGRDCYPDIWIEYAMRIAKELMAGRGSYTAKKGLDYAIDGGGHYLKPAGVVISDVRFVNEVEGLKARGAKVIRIHRPLQGLKGVAGAHRSETEMDSIPAELFDEVLKNDGSLEDLVVMSHALVSKFQIEQRDEGFAQMLTGIDLAAGPDETKVAVVRVEKGMVADIQVGDTTSFKLRPAPGAPVELAEFPLPGAIPVGDGVEVIPAETPEQERLRGMLEARQRDVEAGKIIPFDADQKDIPPFKRKR